MIGNVLGPAFSDIDYEAVDWEESAWEEWDGEESLGRGAAWDRFASLIKISNQP